MASVEVMEAPDKSETDHKSYRIIKLSNGLKAALISVPGQKHTTVEPSTDQSESKSPGENSERTAKLAACSLLVDVGSFSNPPDVQGLAHFLGKLYTNSLIIKFLNISNHFCRTHGVAWLRKISGRERI